MLPIIKPKAIINNGVASILSFGPGLFLSQATPMRKSNKVAYKAISKMLNKIDTSPTANMMY